ncbi:MAG: hypothetical protein WCI74_09915, partial [Actinomycetes bacterium]
GRNENVQSTGLGWAVGTVSQVYGDNNGRETIEGCLRAASAPMVVGNGYSSLNLACAGATTASVLSSTWWKPGIDFANDNKGHVGQARMLEDFARTHTVKAIDLSIGGNDMGFSDIIAACVAAYEVPIVGGHCSNDPKVTKLIDADAKETLVTKISGALGNIVTAMTNAGYAIGSYRIVYQAPPNIIPLPADAKYPGSGYTRQNKCGLPISDRDLTWAIKNVQPTLKSAIVEASAGWRSRVPITVLDTDTVFAGHLLCQKGTSQGLDGIGTPDWAKTGKTTEWVRRISVSEAKFSPRRAVYRSEPMHPTYWGQRALAACTLTAVNSPIDTQTVTCVTPKSAPVPVFTTCKALNGAYPHGVGRVHAPRYVTRLGKRVPFTRSYRLFVANRGLDTNRDGVVCPHP